MNRIYKVIWSKIKYCYVVVSELATSCGKKKSCGTAIYRKSSLLTLFVVLTLMGSTSISMPVQAGSIEINPVASNGQSTPVMATGHNGTAQTHLYNYMNPGNLGDGTVTQNGNYSTYVFYGLSIGNNTQIADSTQAYNGIAMGDYAQATGGVAMAIGLDARATNIAAVAIGPASVASGFNSLAMMRQSAATGDFSTAIGTASWASGNGSFAMGNSATAKGTRSIAIGAADMQQVPTGGSPTATYDDTKNTQSLGDRSIAIGSKARTTEGASDSLALGAATTAAGENSLAIGNNSIAGVANGDGSSKSGNSVAIGG
jgi:hypothetical protein